MADPVSLFVMWKLFGEKLFGSNARPADVHVPPPAPNGHAALPAPQPQPTQPVVTPTQPTFPANVVVPPPAPAPGFKKGVEVWQVKPEVAASAGLLAGAAPAQAGLLSLSSLEQTFPNGWQPCKAVSATEVTTAKALLNQWREGGVVFLGPGNLQQRRAYRMAKHPASKPAPQPQPTQQAAAPAPAPGPTTPAAVTDAPAIQRAPTGVSTSNFPAPPGSDERSLPPDARRPAPPPPAPRTDLPATIRKGASGGSVKRLQGLLNAGLTVDGKFGPKTEAAVKQYQAAHGLTVDGIVGPQTWASLIGN